MRRERQKTRLVGWTDDGKRVDRLFGDPAEARRVAATMRISTLACPAIVTHSELLRALSKKHPAET